MTREAPPVLDLLGDVGETVVERALAELRAARPVVLVSGDEAAIVASVEGLDSSVIRGLGAIAAGTARLVLPHARLRRLGAPRATAGVVALPQIDAGRIELLAATTEARVDAPVAAASALERTALDIVTLAFLLPAVLVVPLVRPWPAGIERLVVLDAQLVSHYREVAVRDLRIVGRAPVPLEGARDTEFVIFRGGEGMRDQVAIVVGKPDPAEPVAVRLHSACLTGDLFGSLKCDCGDQLRGTVKWMSENGGGVLLYLDQEGRGNGLANKIRAYRLQSEGFDTYDADEVLGFGLDQRRFDFAAAMLKMLGFDRVMAMTNNPLKMAALAEAGLEVVAERRVVGRPTAENVRYLASKRDRAGHLIEVDPATARASTGDEPRPVLTPPTTLL